MAAAIEGYASAASAAPGDAVEFHVRAQVAFSHFTMNVYRRGVSDTLVTSAEGDAFVPGSQDDASLAVNGCDWPAAASIIVPAEWSSGYYIAKLTSNGESAVVPFVVRSGAPGATATILVKLSDTTSQAYTAWGGRGFYTTPFSPRVSFDRPYDDVDLYEKYQLPFLRWAEKNGFAMDYCSSVDLHLDPQLLANYRLLLSIGHDEYWSLEMRDQVEAFIAGGGNVCFLSANTCFWQIRFDDDSARTMVCYKEAEPGHAKDPKRDDPGRVTTQWNKQPVNRPENSMTGVSYRNGAGWWNDPIDPKRRYRGYTVTNASHWVFAGTGLSNGAIFGAGTSVDDTILGYETDAALTNNARPPVVLGTDGTPKGFAVLASADLTDWGSGGQAGHATMGLYQRNGIVFTAGTVNWAGGLSANGASTPVDRITHNVLDALARDRAPQLAVGNAGFEDWANGIPTGWTLDGAGTIKAAAADPNASANQMRFSGGGASLSLAVDATRGETWVGRPGLSCAGDKTYAAGCWAKTNKRGATIRLQTTDTWADFASAAHSGSGRWEYLFATGSPHRSGAPVPARVKIQVAAGVKASFDDVTVIEVPNRPA